MILVDVDQVQGTDVRCRAVVGGELRSRKGLNLPGIDLGIGAFTEHDHDCLEFALENGVDAVSQSFVENAPRTLRLCAMRRQALGYRPFIIAKIERSRALNYLDDIIIAADAVMIARGNPGIVDLALQNSQGEGFVRDIGTAMESILLVDDQPANLQVLSQTLESLGSKLLFAKNGETALAIAQKARPDLILLDIMMPGIDGFEVCRRLKANPDTQKIPVIFLSALDETGDKVRGLQLGAVDYVAKPFQPEEVIARVNTHLTIHRLSTEVQKQRDELERELQIVSQLQRNLLPEQLPEIDGLKLAVHYETSRYTGGDYYDFAKLADGRLAILVADAEGHSAPATVLMSMTCALFRSAPTSWESRTGCSPTSTKTCAN